MNIELMARLRAILAWLDAQAKVAFPAPEATFWLTHRLRASPKFWGV